MAEMDRNVGAILDAISQGLRVSTVGLALLGLLVAAAPGTGGTRSRMSYT